jgi:hypothetical protein
MVAPGTGTPLLVVRDDRGELEPSTEAISGAWKTAPARP